MKEVNKKMTCGIFTNIAPLYTRPLWIELLKSEDIEYSFYSSKSGFAGIKTIDNLEKDKFRWYFLKNLYFKKKVIFQIGLISSCIRSNYDAYIFGGEMHNISCWLGAMICRIRNRPVIIWGHGVYGTEKGIKKFLRYSFNRLAVAHLVYGNYARNIMIRAGMSGEKLFTCYNSLDFSIHQKIYLQRDDEYLKSLRQDLFRNNSNLPVIIFIGRLTPEKKLSILLDAIKSSLVKGNIYNCLFVGDGTEYENLRKKAENLGISEQVCFYGASYDEVNNSNLIMMADCCVSPGNIGLTAIYSLSLGTPVITHDNMGNQMPEAEAVIPGETGLFFREDDAEDLASSIDDMLGKRRKVQMEKNCIRHIENFWNPKNQSAIFDKAIMYSIKLKN